MRRNRRKGVNKDKVFGCDLLEHLTTSSQEIPQVLQCCSEFVEKHGVVDGIYRLSGVSSNIQKLRGEFESDGSPDLNKDLYLQDIHCVSSLTKAYFRELPNPLLTYQLYDKFAEAVALQLEEERLVKIRNVLKELPEPHHRTLQFLMRHLVKMASFCSETNMHSRNLAIVWAPNLLRSKDIETSGFNGTAAFMEVRVQSIVVEFILTHVPQLFPEEDLSSERRKSLPSPSPLPNQDEGFFKGPVHHFGNISPGDGPLAMRPYHAIIEGTDKRKGSLKGRKWMSIFNIGGRFQDPRRRHKLSTKEKERPALRPARSMDSLSNPPYPNDASRRPCQRPPSTHMSPLVTPSPQPASEVPASPGAIGGSEYAVTYRRGTGLVSGGAGTQGTYTSLDPEGLSGNETLLSRSPGLSTKVGRRAAMHITGPTMVTVPLHITSNLALGVLQRGGDSVIHRGRDKEGGDRVEGKEGGEKVERRESKAMERKVAERQKVEQEEEEKSRRGKVKVRDVEEVMEAEGEMVIGSGRDEDKKEEEKEEGELLVVDQAVSKELRAKSLASNTEEDNAVEDDNDLDEYMAHASFTEMKDVQPADCETAATQHDDGCVFDDADVLNSTQVDGDHHEMSGYVQDNFEFLDQMDCNMDHMDCSVSYQVNEFSVEPPGHSDDEYEVMDPSELQTELKPTRPLSINSYNRHTKSLSLPYLTSPVPGLEDSGSEEDGAACDSDDYSSEEDESMFIKSLPAEFFLNNLTFERDTDKQEGGDGVPEHQSQSCADRGSQSLCFGFPACEESAAVGLEQEEGKDEGDKDGPEEKEMTEKEDEDHQGRDHLENNGQSKATEEEVMEDSQSDKEEPLTPEAFSHCCYDFPPPIDEDFLEEADMLDNHHSDSPPSHEVVNATQEEADDACLEEIRDFSEPPTKERDSDEGEEREVFKEIESESEDIVMEIKESDENLVAETPEKGNEVEEILGEKLQGGDTEQGSDVCGASSEIWAELEDVICEGIEDVESTQVEEKDDRESVSGEGDVTEDVEEQVAEVSEEMVEVEEEETNKTEVRVEDVEEEETNKTEVRVGEVEEEETNKTEVRVEDVEEEETNKTEVRVEEVEEEETNKTEVRVEEVEESMETIEEKLPDTEVQREMEEEETNVPKTSEPEEGIQGKHAITAEDQHHNGEEVTSKENNEKADEQRQVQLCIDKHLKALKCDVEVSREGRKGEEGDSSLGGVGRKIVISRNPKVYQVKAVPVVPPKPQHCRVTALNIRQQQQQQQREKRDADRERENASRVASEQDGAGDGEEDKGEKTTQEREKRMEGDESRNSPLSMCFDEAVAIEAMRRGKEKECEKEKERQKDWGNEVQ
ncbi:transcriptional regulator ATRX isoform X1 [Trematomus bernacchii]|uniref:transcriptional regulator ATRX isoform X1 n=1 Tax=Trematomus bernacchii TaxID=40690 RepID=UPI00146D47B3|nr:transcriptional regulator ATRX isoform X1 [Trematomus bernacchii]